MENNSLQQAILLQQQGQTQDAIKIYINLLDDINTNNKDKSAVCVNIANIFLDTDILQKALIYCKKALEFDRLNYYAMLNLGVVFYRAGKYKKALKQYKKLKKLIKKNKNRQIDIYNQLKQNIAFIYYAKKDYNKAIKIFKKIDIKNLNDEQASELEVNIGDCYMNKLDLKKASKHYKKAYQLNPYNQFAINNQALCLKKELYYDEALKLYQEALKIDPKNYRIRYNYAIALLESGDYRNGWKEYEARLELDFSSIKQKKRDLGIPLYQTYTPDLSKLMGRKLLIVYEQGFGDNLMVFRYIKELQKKGIEVYALVYKELVRIFSTIDGLHIITNDTIEDISKCDYFILSMSLPFYFKCTLDNIPNKQYLFAKKEPFIDKLFKNSEQYRLKIGFVWNGDKNNIHNSTRALKLQHFKTIFDIKDIGFYSLQIDNSKKELKKYQKRYSNIIDCSDFINDFYDTASIINELDFVIAIDSAVVHLSGALSKETIVILPKTPEIRWVYNLKYSPWYPNTKIIRQSEDLDLYKIFDKIKMLFN